MFRQLDLNGRFGPFLLHLVIGTLGTLLITGLMSLLISLLGGRRFVSLIALGPLFLLPILSGLVLGYTLAKILPRYGAVWVWVVPAVFLAVNIAGALTSRYERRTIWINEFGPQTVTAPLVGCIGYALGAALRRNNANMVTARQEHRSLLVADCSSEVISRFNIDADDLNVGNEFESILSSHRTAPEKH